MCAPAVADADLVVLCTPVGLFKTMLSELSAVLRPGTIVTDVGSTKASVVRHAARLLPRTVHFIGSHPMAGSEKRGVEFARADLFHDALCITTPTPRSSPSALKQVEAFWKRLGMRIARLTPASHDSLLADVSHLPHALAASLVAMQRPSGLRLAGKGFLDTTRIAGGDGALWRDILLDNRQNIAASLGRLRRQIGKLQKMLRLSDASGIAAWLNAAAERREALLNRKLGEVNPD